MGGWGSKVSICPMSNFSFKQKFGSLKVHFTDFTDFLADHAFHQFSTKPTKKIRSLKVHFTDLSVHTSFTDFCVHTNFTDSLALCSLPGCFPPGCRFEFVAVSRFARRRSIRVTGWQALRIAGWKAPRLWHLTASWVPSRFTDFFVHAPISRISLCAPISRIPMCMQISRIPWLRVLCLVVFPLVSCLE